MEHRYTGGVRTTPQIDPTTGHMTRITIDIHPDTATTDSTTPGGTLHRFAADPGCLTGLLAALATPQPETRDLHTILNSLASARDLARDHIPHLATLARDRDAWSWRRIATALGIAHRTVERQVTATRRELAEAGVWIDANGIHDGTTTASDHLDHAERVVVARALAHHRETAGATWDHPVQISAPARITPGQTTTAGVLRHEHMSVESLVITTPVTLDGGPAHGQVLDVVAGATTHTTPDGALYRPTTPYTWTHQKESR